MKVFKTQNNRVLIIIFNIESKIDFANEIFMFLTDTAISRKLVATTFFRQIKSFNFSSYFSRTEK